MARRREVPGDVGQDEGQQEEVERVQGPAEQGGEEGRPLGFVQRLQLIDDHHLRLPLGPAS